MRKLTLAGHPLHPQLITLPAGLMPFSFAMDIAYLATKKPVYATTAFHTLLGAAVGAVLAGGAGAADYLTIDSHTKAKRTANVHALMNVGLLALTAVNLLVRKRDTRRTSTGSFLMSLVGNLGLYVGAWYGGHLVYAHGVRVKGVSPIARVPEWKLRGDERVEDTLTGLEERVPDGGPTRVSNGVH